MYLRHRDSLRIGEIVRAWPEERDGPSAPHNALTLLLQGFWQAQLTGVHGPGHEDNVFSRERALKALVAIDAKAPHPDLVLDSEKQEAISSETRSPDGSVVLDLRKRIILPEDRASWTETQRAEAYKVLFECRSDDYSAEFLEGFRSLRVAKRPFLIFIHLYRLRPPSFWFDPDQPGKGLPSLSGQSGKSSASRKRGRPATFDYGRIDEFLEKLLLDEGLAAFDNKATVHKRVKKHLGAKSVPRESYFGTYLNEWMEAHDPPLRIA